MVKKSIHTQHPTCSLFIEAIKGKIIGLSRAGSSDIQTTAAATKADTVTCRLLCRLFQNVRMSMSKSTSEKPLESLGEKNKTQTKKLI